MIVGFVFGNGILPCVLLENVKHSVCAILGETPKNISLARTHKQFEITQIPQIISFFKENGVTHICLAGFIQKPSITMKMFNFRLAPLLFKILTLSNKGDNTLLTTILSHIQSKGFEILSATEIVPSLLAKAGVLTSIKPSFNEMKEIALACNFLHDVSKYDISQSCLVQNNTIIALEGIEGTQNMIKRMAQYNKNAILVKMPKTGQNLKADMPTIGVDTILACSNYAISGIAIKAEGTIVLEQDLVINAANERGMFIISLA